MLFLQKFIPAQDVSIYARETPAPGNPEAALMSRVYLIHGNICRAWLSPHINIVFWARVSAGTMPLECHKYLLFKQLCSCILFFGAEEEQRSVFGVLDMLSYLLHQWQLHIKPVPARLSPLHPISPTAMSYSGRLCCAHQNFCRAQLLWLYGQLNAELILFWDCFCLVF